MDRAITRHGQACHSCTITCDYFIRELRAFIVRCADIVDHRRCLHLIGDATHDESSQGLKKLLFGLAGFHFVDGQFRNALLPLVFAAIGQEKYETVKQSLLALFELVHRISGLWLPDYILHWYYDVHPGAMRALRELIPHGTGHLCLQHSKVNADRKALSGYKALIEQMEDFLALLPNIVFHLSVDTLFDN